MRWLVDVENDIWELKVMRWRLNASTKEEWPSILKKDKSHRGI
jgi:hypothetical protein